MKTRSHWFSCGSRKATGNRPGKLDTVGVCSLHFQWDGGSLRTFICVLKRQTKERMSGFKITGTTRIKKKHPQPWHWVTMCSFQVHIQHYRITKESCFLIHIQPKTHSQSILGFYQYGRKKRVLNWSVKCAKSLQSCPTLGDHLMTVAHQLPLSGGFSGKSTGGGGWWFAISSFRASTQPRDWTRVSYVSFIGWRVLYH